MHLHRSLLAALFVLPAALGCPAGDAGEEGEGEGEAGEGEGEGGDVVAVAGIFCPVEDRVGFVRIVHSFDTVFLDGRIDDAVPVSLGPPVVDEAPCAHYHPADCGGCGGGEVCGYDGSCVAPVSAIAGVVVEVTTAGGTDSYAVNEFGRLEGAVDDVAGEYALRVQIPGQPDIVFAAGFPGGFTDLVTLDQGTFETGPVTLSWSAQADADDAQVRLFLKPNHHVPVGFSECLLDDSAETVTASAAIIDPLRKVTGFEGGTGSRMHVGAAQLDIGCVEISVQRDELLSVQTLP